MMSINDIYGLNVFNESVMRERLPKATYKLLKQTIDKGLPLEESIAEIVALKKERLTLLIGSNL